jgi:two-component system cell cycle sensor histidine kinase/response regulator CckA
LYETRLRPKLQKDRNGLFMERTDFEQWKAREVARLLALVETERRYYQEMVASLPVALVVLSADRSIVSANRAFRQMFGVRTEELRRKSIEQIVGSAELVEKIRDLHVHGTPQPDVRVQVEHRTLRAALVPIRNWDDESEMETLLMLEEVPAAAPVSGIPMAPVAPVAPQIKPALDIPAIVWEADAERFVFASVNGAVEQMLGYPVEHWLNTARFFEERIHPEDRPATMSFYRAAAEREGDASTEFRAVRPQGEALWCRETIRVKPGGVITGVLTDISLRKQLEEQLLNSQRADALHGLASKLAHDLNNPLMIITGYGEEMLHALKPEDSMRADVQQIMGATERISGITGHLLGYTRKLANPPQRVDVAEVIAGLEDKIAGTENVQVDIRARDGVWAMADAGQLAEVILALASGEREDAKERTRLAIACDVETIPEQIPGATIAPGIYASILVYDNGRGTDAKVFEAVLAKDAVSAAVSRAYSTVREWGGDIAFASAPFHGSTFTIYLPYAEPEAATAPAEPEPAEPVVVEVPAPPPEPARETILLVEDEAGIRALVRKILRRERYEVLEAGSAEEAINVAAAHHGSIDLLVTDVMLPGKGGRELAETMRSLRPDLKVLYISGFTSDEDVRAGAFPPGSRFLQKPFTLTSLVGTVREALGNEAAAHR